MPIKDSIYNETKIHNLTIVPKKDQNNLLLFYHTQTGHKNYLILNYKIIKENFYWNNLVESCKEYIKNCNICTTKNKALFFPPPCHQIICNMPKELYVIDLHRFQNYLKKIMKKFILSQSLIIF